MLLAGELPQDPPGQRVCERCANRLLAYQALSDLTDLDVPDKDVLPRHTADLWSPVCPEIAFILAAHFAVHDGAALPQKQCGGRGGARRPPDF